MKKSVILTFIIIALYVINASAEVVKSPDERLSVNVEIINGSPCYSVSYDGKEFIKSSPLGLITNIGDFTKGLDLECEAFKVVDQSYTMPNAKAKEIDYLANELTTTLTKGDDTLCIIFRVSNNNIAFCYQLLSKDKLNVIVKAEATGFHFPSYTTAFISPQSLAGTGWCRTKPSYEEEYTIDEPIGTPSKYNQGYVFPALFHLGQDGWALVSETGTDSQYCGCHLSNGSKDGLYTIAFPQENENNGIGRSFAASIIPMQTPWRTITIGTDLKPIVESTIAWDVVEPRYEASQSYEPGKAAWSWIQWKEPSCNYDDQMLFIDMAAKMHIKYILIDILWDQQIGYDKMPKLVQYAQSKGINVLLWYNSNGAWNDAPYTPRGKMDTSPARQKEMKWLKDIGVKGIKVDFFGGDKQETMKLYEDILTDANRYGLMVIFHGATIPRGWQRMYPNFASCEAVTASENLTFEQRYADLEALWTTILPYTRNAIGAMDFGIVMLNKRFSKNQYNGTYRKTTDALELATAIVYDSPIQTLGIVPNNLDQFPQYVFDYLSDVPTAWDETRFIFGTPGKDIAIARRKGNNWYVGITNGENVNKQLILNMPMLAGKKVTLYYDMPDRSVGKKNIKVNKKGLVTIKLLNEGGAVLVAKE
jgi:hypothetical protein